MVVIGVCIENYSIINDLVLQYYAADILLYNEHSTQNIHTPHGIKATDNLHCLLNHFYKKTNRFVVLTTNNHIRELQVKRYTQLGGKAHYFVSTTANYNAANSYVSNINTVIMHNAMISASAQISEGCIISPHSYVGHDSVMGRYAFLGEYSGGSLTHIGAYSTIDADSAVLPGAGLGTNCKVAGNTLVTKTFANNKFLKGVPARE